MEQTRLDIVQSLKNIIVLKPCISVKSIKYQISNIKYVYWIINIYVQCTIDVFHTMNRY